MASNKPKFTEEEMAKFAKDYFEYFDGTMKFISASDFFRLWIIDHEYEKEVLALKGTPNE